MPENFIGTDIVSVLRIENSLSSVHSKQFKKRIFTNNETIYCENKPNPAIHFAGRFAAKEAIIKALSSSDKWERIAMNVIEILSGKDGQPIVNIPKKNNVIFNCKVSISHTEEFALAFAVLEVY